MQEVIVSQGNIYDINLKESFLLKDNGFGPCIVIIYIYGGDPKFLSYTHFDEECGSELKSFIKVLEERNVSNVIMFGGRGSILVGKLIKDLRRKSIDIVSDSYFNLIGINSLEITNEEIKLKTFSSELKKLSFSTILSLLIF